MSLTKIGSIGINTGIQFAGVTTIATLNASDNVLSVGGTVNFVSDVSIGGTVSIAGTLTYEDVTNVDAVGLITARDGIVVGSGITLSVDGDGFFTGVITATSYSGIDLSDVTGATGDFSIADKIVHTGDTDTAIRFSAADTVSVETGGTQKLSLGSATVFNETGEDVDFRIESDTKTHMFFVDAGNNRIGINVDTPVDTLHAKGSVYLTLNGSNANEGHALKFQTKTGGFDTSYGAAIHGLRVGDASSYLRFDTGGQSEKMRLDENGKLAIGNASPQQLLHVWPDTANTTSAYIRVTAGDRGSGTGIDLGHDSSGNGHLNMVSNGNLTLSTNNTARVHIKNSGNVGINSNEPASILDIVESHVPKSWSQPDSVVTKFERNGHCRLALVAANSSQSQIDFADNDDDNAGYIRYDHSDNTMAFRTGGSSERLIIDDGGHIGFNVTPGDWDSTFRAFEGGGNSKHGALHFQANGDWTTSLGVNNYFNGGWKYRHDGGAAWLEMKEDSLKYLQASSGTASNAVSWNERLRITSDGSIGILAQGANADSGAGHVTWPYSGTPFHLKYYSNTTGTNGSYAQYIENYVGSDIGQQKTFIGIAMHDDNSNDRPQVKFGAEVGQRGDANTQLKEGSGNFVVYTNTGDTSYDDSATEKFVVQYNGTATISGSTVTSDARLKTDVTTLTGTLDKVKQLRGVEYLWNDVAIDNRGMVNRSDGEKQIGVIADEVKPIYPVLVEDNGLRGRDGTQYKQVAYEKLVPILLEAIKELAAKVEALEG